VLLMSLILIADLKLTAFYRMGSDPRSTAALVCGEAKGALTGNEKVHIVSDPGKYSTEYMTTLTSNGTFCQVISSYGRVFVELVDKTQPIASVEGKL
jgi:hypothetical protein